MISNRSFSAPESLTVLFLAVALSVPASVPGSVRIPHRIISRGLELQELGTNTWSLHTEDTEIRLSVVESHPVIMHLASRADERNWLGAPAPLLLTDKVRAGEKTFALAWRFEQAKLAPQDGRLTLCFTNEQPGLALRSLWQARPGHGPIEHRLEIENRSGQTLTLFHQDSLGLRGLHAPGPATAHWIKRGGSNADTEGGVFAESITDGFDLPLASNCADGASPVPWLALQAGAEGGLYVGWEFSGLGRIRARSDLAPGQVAIDVGNHPDFQTDLEPGEVFLVPPAFVGCYAGDLDEGSYCLHRFILEKLRPVFPARRPDPILAYNLYLDAGGNQAREAAVLRCAATCRDLGFEAFMPDAMWFPQTGDWRWDPARFPRGVQPVEEYVHGNGMQLALWCAWSNGGLAQDNGALNVRRQPDWFNEACAPDWHPGPFWGAHLCLGCEGAKEWAITKTQWLVAQNRLDYLKHDIDPIVVQCPQTTHRHRYGVDVSYWAAMGYYDVQEKLLRTFPNLILENCSGGGHIKDFGVIQRSHYTVTTDTLSNLADRRSIYDSTFALPPLILQAYTYDNYYPVPGDGPGTFLWRSAMMGAWQIDPTDTAKWSEAERDSARRSVRIYKEWIRPLLQDVKVHHILPRPDGRHWDGLFYWSPALRKGTVYVFRPDSPADQQTVRLKGLEPQKRYQVWCEDGSLSPGTRSGQELMEGGVAVRLPERFSSDLLCLQDASLSEAGGAQPPGEFALHPARATSDMFAAQAELSWEPSLKAHSYRVVVGHTAEFQPAAVEKVVGVPALEATGLPSDEALYWKVEAIGRGGVRTNAGGAQAFRTPALASLKGIVFASDLPWTKATAGAGNEVRRDKNYGGRAITIGGKTYRKGLWTHSFNDQTPADTGFDLTGRHFAVFKAQVGLDDLGEKGSVQFQVLVDGRLRAESPIMRPRQVHSLVAAVAGASEVTLRVLNGGDGYAWDHAAWGFARFAEAGASDPLD